MLPSRMYHMLSTWMWQGMNTGQADRQVCLRQSASHDGCHRWWCHHWWLDNPFFFSRQFCALFKFSMLCSNMHPSCQLSIVGQRRWDLSGHVNNHLPTIITTNIDRSRKKNRPTIICRCRRQCKFIAFYIYNIMHVNTYSKSWDCVARTKRWWLDYRCQLGLRDIPFLRGDRLRYGSSSSRVVFMFCI